MWDRVQWMMVVASVAFLALIVELIRRRHLKEEYSLLWLVGGGVLLVLSVGRSLLEDIATFLGIHYAPSAMFLIGGLIAMALGMHVTIVISKLTDQSRILAQKLALVEERLSELERRSGPPPS